MPDIVVPGHIYDCRQLGTDQLQRMTFIRRSGGAIQYPSEWAGLQVQEVLRVLIDRSVYLNEIIPCAETENSIYHLRMALFEYEARAYRRKVEGKNRKQPEHDDGARPRPWRDDPYDDVPFNEFEIEKRPIGPDGHILLNEDFD